MSASLAVGSCAAFVLPAFSTKRMIAHEGNVLANEFEEAIVYDLIVKKRGGFPVTFLFS